MEEEDGERLGNRKGSEAAGTGGAPNHLHRVCSCFRSSEKGGCLEESTGEVLRGCGCLG